MGSCLRRIKNRLGPLWWHSLLMFAVLRVGDLIGFYIGMVLVMDRIDAEELGAVLPLTRLGLFVAVPLTIVGQTALKFINRHMVQGETGKVKRLLRDLAILSSAVSALVVVLLWVGWSWVRQALGLEDDRILWIISLSVLLACWHPILTSIAQGVKNFRLLILARLAGPVARLVVVLALIGPLGIAGYMAGNVAMPLAAIVVLASVLRPVLSRQVAGQSYRDELGEIGRFMVPVGIMTSLMLFLLLVGPWVIRTRLPAGASAGYYAAAMFGNIPLWVAPAMLPFLFPVVAERHEKGLPTTKIHMQVLGFVLLVGGVITILIALIAPSLLSLRASWRAYGEYGKYAWMISLACTFYILANCHATHENACHRFAYLWIMVPTVLLECSLLLMPTAWVRGMVLEFGLTYYLSVILGVRLLGVAGIMVQILLRSARAGAPGGVGHV